MQNSKRNKNAVDIFIIGRNIILTYEIPNIFFNNKNFKLTDFLGKLVIIPLRKEKLIGCIIKENKTYMGSLLKVEEMLSENKYLFKSSLYLAEFISNYYGSSFVSALNKIFPSGLYLSVKRNVKKLKEIDNIFISLSPTLNKLNKKSELNYDSFIKNISDENNKHIFSELIDKNYISISFTLPPPLKPINRQKICILNEIKKIKYKKIEEKIINLLLLNTNRLNISKIEDIIGLNFKKGLITLLRNKTIRIELDKTYKDKINYILSDEQKKALSEINNAIILNISKTFLLYGITGSGKTLLYKETVNNVLQKGKTALILVPEIGLVPQLFNFFKIYFPMKRIGLFHSSISPKRKFDTFRLAASGKIDIIIGTRSSIFIPLANLGLIIIDEEHSAQYKEEESPPLYNARDIAVIRQKNEKLILILGSATPSIESYINSQKNKYHLLQLKERIKGLSLPECKISYIKSSVKSSLSYPLIKEMKRGFENNEQIILLMNRRGYSNFVICPVCGYTVVCDNCNVSMTYHKSEDKLICHYCNKKKKIPDICPKCDNFNFHLHGWGVERVEKEFKKLFPSKNIIRLDTDILKKTKKKHEDFFDLFHQQHCSVLLGTQMVAKGLDFPKVSIVGIIDADSSLSFPDFRASESAFQLIVQAAGRAGRATNNGIVIIQTRNPKHPIILFAKKHNYEGFIKWELNSRKMSFFPPFCRLIRIIISSKDKNRAFVKSKKIKLILKKINQFYEILGPTIAPLEKIRNRYRFHILLKVKKNIIIGNTIYNKTLPLINKDLKVIIDVDPLWML